MKKKFNPYMSYIPLYGIYYTWKNLDELYETTMHWAIGSFINSNAVVYAFGGICLLF